MDSYVKITCPNCSFSRDVPTEKVPDKPVQVTCPGCKQCFPFSRPIPPPPDPLPENTLDLTLPNDISPPPPGRVSLPGATTFRGTPPAAPAGKPAPLPLVLLALAVLVGIGWWLNFPQAEPVLDGSHTDQKNSFAVKAPPDWLLVTPDNYQAIMQQYRDKIPREVSAMFGKGAPGFAVSFLRIPANEKDFSPNFNVVVVDTKGKNLPALTESEKSKAAAVVSGEISRHIRGYKMNEATITEVDGIDSLQIVGGAEITVTTKPSEPIVVQGPYGRRQFVGRTEAETETYRMRVLQTMVPGSKKAYVVSFMYDDLKTPEMDSVHRQILESFRVLERPPRFGGIFMGALNGGLIGAGIYLLGFCAARLFRTD